MTQVGEHVDDACFREAIDRNRLAETFYGHARVGIEGGEEETWRGNIDNATAINACKANAFAVIGAHRILASGRVGLTVRPERLARLGVNRHHVALIARNGE